MEKPLHILEWFELLYNFEFVPPLRDRYPAQTSCMELILVPFPTHYGTPRTWIIMKSHVKTGLKLENYYFFTFTFSRPEVRKLLLFYVFTFSRPEVGKWIHISMA